MKTIITLVALAAAAPFWNPKTQEPGGPPPAEGRPETRGLVKVEASRDFDRDLWRGYLTDPDLEERERRFDQIVGAARQDRAAEGALREWARGTGDLAWTARLALRELDRSGGPLRPRSLRSTHPWFDLFEPFDALEPFAPFDPLHPRHSTGDPRHSTGDPRHSTGDPFESMRERVQRMLEDFRGADPLRLPPGTGESRSESFRLRSTPDGVEVEVERQTPEGTTRETYEGKSIEELLERHPELRQHLDLNLDWGRDLGQPLLRRRDAGDPDGDPQGDRDGATEDEAPWRLRRAPERVERTDILGVYLRAASPQAPGLEVAEVAPRTIASVLGLGVGDRLLELDGVTLGTVDDVRRAMAAREPDGDLRLRLITADGEEQTRVWSPSDRPR